MSSSDRGAIRSARATAARVSHGMRGYDVGRVVARNSDGTYRLQIMARRDIDGAEVYTEDASPVDSGFVAEPGENVLVSRTQGATGRPGIVGHSPWAGGGISKVVEV